MSVEQIRYSHYRQKLEPGHEDYWEVIDLLASNIGTRLESHGIRVSQTKEKYGRAVVYLQGGLRNADLGGEGLEHGHAFFGDLLAELFHGDHALGFHLGERAAEQAP